MFKMAMALERWQLKLLISRDTLFVVFKDARNELLDMIENNADFESIHSLYVRVNKEFQNVHEAHQRYTLSIDQDFAAIVAAVEFKLALDTQMQEIDAKMEDCASAVENNFSPSSDFHSVAQLDAHPVNKSPLGERKMNDKNSNFESNQLPEVKMMRPFNGDPRTWPEFISNYEKLVHKPLKTNAQKHARLQQLLAPEVRSCISEYLVSHSTYGQAITNLKEKFGNPKIILHAHLQGILKLKYVKEGDLVALEKLLKTANQALNFFHSSGFNNEIKSKSTLENISSKLPPKLLAAWGKKSFIATSNLNLKDFTKWLEENISLEKAHS